MVIDLTAFSTVNCACMRMRGTGQCCQEVLPFRRTCQCLGGERRDGGRGGMVRVRGQGKPDLQGSRSPATADRFPSFAAN